jgi:hypothetical protein
MTTKEANKFLYHGDKARIARKFKTTFVYVYQIAIGKRYGKFGKAKMIAEEIIRTAEQNIADGFVAPKSNKE